VENQWVQLLDEEEDLLSAELKKRRAKKLKYLKEMEQALEVCFKSTILYDELKPYRILGFTASMALFASAISLSSTFISSVVGLYASQSSSKGNSYMHA